MRVDINRDSGEHDAAVTANTVDPILFARLERLDQPRIIRPRSLKGPAPQEVAQLAFVVEYGYSRGTAAMRRFDHAWVSEFGDGVVEFEC